MNINIPLEILTVLEKIFNDTTPLSVFLYGSQSRGDTTKNSDFEFGVIYSSETKVSRQELAKYHNIKNLEIYPFALEYLQSLNIDTPFPKAIYIKNIIENSITIKGDDILKTISPPTITKTDLIEQINFSLGRAFSAVLSHRNGDPKTCAENFTKSVFHGFMTLIFLRQNILYPSYTDIIEKSKTLEIKSEFVELLEHAKQIRNNNVSIDPPKIYKNISFLNFVRSEILK
jgi:predicted nucleotidyltransferase